MKRRKCNVLKKPCGVGSSGRPWLGSIEWRHRCPLGSTQELWAQQSPCFPLEGPWCDRWREPSDQLIVSLVLVPCSASPGWTEHLRNPPTSLQNSRFILQPLKLVGKRVSPHTLCLQWFSHQLHQNSWSFYCFCRIILKHLITHPRPLEWAPVAMGPRNMCFKTTFWMTMM